MIQYQITKLPSRKLPVEAKLKQPKKITKWTSSAKLIGAKILNHLLVPAAIIGSPIGLPIVLADYFIRDVFNLDSPRDRIPFGVREFIICAWPIYLPIYILELIWPRLKFLTFVKNRRNFYQRNIKKK